MKKFIIFCFLFVACTSTSKSEVNEFLPVKNRTIIIPSTEKFITISWRSTSSAWILTKDLHKNVYHFREVKASSMLDEIHDSIIINN
jgi:hypothetical protein